MKFENERMHFNRKLTKTFDGLERGLQIIEIMKE